MAGRFLIQKFSSLVSRSAGALATGAASEGGVRAPSNLFNGAAKTACTEDVMVVEGEFMRRQKWLLGFTLVATALGFVCDELRPSKRARTGRCSSCGRE